MRYDLAVVGGGIVGAGVARDAALRGLKVALFEKEDLAAGTTSRSTRLIHGGLRYLAQYDFSLVREALHERATLLRIAPHLVRPLPFLFPMYRGRGTALPVLWSGLLLYDYMSPQRGVPHHRLLPSDVCRRLEPSLRPRGLRGGFLFYDAQCAFPERLCLENALDAADHGARVDTHTRVVGLERSGDAVTGVRVRDELTGGERTVEASLVLNCAGPWLDEVERLAAPEAPLRLRRTKGVHVVVPRFTSHALILETARADRVVFAIPWGDHTLIGTTDTDYEGENEAVSAGADDVAYLLREVAAVLDHEVRREDILFTTAGLRPLVRELGRSTAEITRRHAVVDHERTGGVRGYATVVGGKITTYRHIAEEIVDFVERKLGRRRTPCRTARQPLPGGRIEGSWTAFLDGFLSRARAAGVDADIARHLADHYGAAAEEVLAAIRARPRLGARLDGSGPWVWAEVERAVARERARTVTDVLLRRLSIGLSRGQGRAVAPAVADAMASQLGWDRRRAEAEVAAFRAALDRNWTPPR